MISIPSELAENDEDGDKAQAVLEACASVFPDKSPEIRREHEAVLAAYSLTERSQDDAD